MSNSIRFPPIPGARTVCRACRRRRSISASPRISSTPTGRSTSFWRSGTSSASCIALRIVRSPVGAVLQRDPRQSAARRRGRPQYPWLQAHRLRRRRGLCGFCRRAARRDAGLHAARRLHVRHLRTTGDADRDRRRGHAVRPAGRRRGLALSQRLPADLADLGATWKLVLGIVFVLLVCFLRRGMIGGIEDLVRARDRPNGEPRGRPPAPRRQKRREPNRRRPHRRRCDARRGASDSRPSCKPKA